MSSQAPPPVANSGEDAITRTMDVQPDVFAGDGTQLSFEEAYEIESTLHEIQKGGYNRIALQFPDELLHDSVAVYRMLRERLAPEKELYVLADTTYGSCCVDEVAAQHVDADLIVHYGHTCLSPTARLPVMYVLTKRDIEPDDAANSLASTSRDQLGEAKAVILMYDVGFAHRADEVYNALAPKISLPLVMSQIDRRGNVDKKGKGPTRDETASEGTFADEGDDVESRPDTTPADGVSDLPPAPTPQGLVPSDALPSKPDPPRISYDLPQGVDSVEECAIFYIGGESLALKNLLMTHGRCSVWSYDPRTRAARLESGKTNRMLMRRYAVVEKAKDADVIGILVGTLGVSAYLPLIKHLRELIAARQKKSYTVAVGKLNPAKLANFLEVECFVLVACPENTLIESKEFLRPIVTPFELELALTSKSWTGDYILDFTALLSSTTFGQTHVDPSLRAAGDASDDDEGDEDRPIYSSTTGKYRHPKRYTKSGVNDEADLDKQASALSIRDQNSAVARVLGSAAGEFLAGRSYKGLEPRYGMDAPAVVEDMSERGGIARGYAHDKDVVTGTSADRD